VTLGEEPIAESSGVPREFFIYQNYPNPFNPSTTLQFDVPELPDGPAEVRINIYNNLGQEVKSLFKGRLDAGNFSLLWDGTDTWGRAVPAGIYFAELRTDEYRKVIRMTLMK
jgi:flagellar hook assembly protein FlgD